MQSLLSVQIFIQNISYFKQDFGFVNIKKYCSFMTRKLLTYNGLK